MGVHGTPTSCSYQQAVLVRTHFVLLAAGVLLVVWYTASYIGSDEFWLCGIHIDSRHYMYLDEVGRYSSAYLVGLSLTIALGLTRRSSVGLVGSSW